MTADRIAPEAWEQASRRITAKALGELAHERLIAPEPEGDDYVVRSDDGATAYRFAARRWALDHWAVDPASVRRERDDAVLEPDALALVGDLRARLELDGERLGLYLEEVAGTVAALARRLSAAPLTAAELAAAEFQTIEARVDEGHPCFVANSGRHGFDSDDLRAYAPEAGADVRLVWVAARRDRAHLSTGQGLDESALLAGELDAATLERFAGRLAARGARLDEHHLIPVHPWQWRERIAVTFAPDLARGDLVALGEGPDAYRAQQSIRTFFNLSVPARHYVKTALSVVNMGFVRGLSATYMRGTPQINDWVAGLVGADPVLRETRVEVLRERAAVGYESATYAAVDAHRAPYRKMLAALWRESPVPRLGPGERVMTMAALLHRDAAGRSLAGALVDRSGESAERWLDAYLAAYLRPLLRCFAEHRLVFMPHGENVILVLRDDVVDRVLLKDIAEEVVLMDPEAKLPEAVERIRVDVPGELQPLSILTDVVDCFLRFLAPLLATEGRIDEAAFWERVAACVAEFEDAAPGLAADEFALSCLNRLQLADTREMVDLQDPAGSLRFAGTLRNPIARAATLRG